MFKRHVSLFPKNSHCCVLNWMLQTSQDLTYAEDMHLNMAAIPTPVTIIVLDEDNVMYHGQDSEYVSFPLDYMHNNI